MGIIKVSRDDQFLITTGDTPLLEVYDALPPGLYPPFPPVELPGGVGGLIKRGGFAQTFFFASEILGITFRTPKGDTVQAGGRVVKNVQGYDLVRPFVGSFGVLGEPLELTLRLRPGLAFTHLVTGGSLESLPDARPRFAWMDGGKRHIVHYGAPLEVEALKARVGGTAITDPLDYRARFSDGMGVATGEDADLSDLRFGWVNGSQHPEVPPLFKTLVEALSR